MTSTKFKKIVEKELLQEMPYIMYGNTDEFDLELEKYFNKNDFRGFLDKIEHLINGKEITDKYGNKARLDSPEKIKQFANSLKQDMSMPLALWRFFNHWIADQIKRKSS